MIWHWGKIMNSIEEKIYKDILTMIKDNLQILIYNHDSCLYHFYDYCLYLNNILEESPDNDITIDQDLLTLFTEESLYALLNADFLYDYRDIE